jgi:hypothetical protein
MKRKESDDSWGDMEFFGKKGARISSTNIKVTITDNQTILFSAAFCHKADLQGKTAIKLGYSPSKHAIIFDFTEDQNTEGAFRLIQRGSSAATTCRSFFNAYDLDKAKTAGHYIPHKEKIPRVGEMWVIMLHDKI